MTDGPRIVFATASITASSFLREEIAQLSARGADVTLITGPSGPADFPCEVEVISSLGRDPSPLNDLRALRATIKVVRRRRPDVVHASTPKAALFGLIAAFVARVPRRVYLVRGLRLETASLPARLLLGLLEWLTCRLATDVVVVSRSLGAAMAERHLVAERRVTMIGAGASAGVDTSHFRPAEASSRTSARDALGIGPGDVVLVFVGRLHRDKGLATLIEAYGQLRASHTQPIWLVTAGEVEGDAKWRSVVKQWLAEPGVIALGQCDDVRPVYAVADVAVLPSLREGLPNVVLEASACGIPVVVTDSVGTRDAAVDGLTGRVVPTGDASALAAALSEIISRPDRGRELGEAGRAWVHANFEKENVVRNHVDYLMSSGRGRH